MQTQTPDRAITSARRTRSAGQALAEFAVILIVLMLLVMGVVDLSRAVYIRSVVANAAREGARYAVVHTKASQEDYTSGIEAAVKGLAVGVPASDLSIEIVPSYPVTGTADVEVRVTYIFHPATGFFVKAAGIDAGEIPLVGSAKMRREP